MDTIVSLVDTLLLHLAWTSIQASLLIGLLWLLGRSLPRLPTPTRCLLWWLLGAQLLVGLAWQAPVALPLLPPAHVTAIAAQAPPMIRVDAQKTATAPTVANTGTDASRASLALSWREALAALWLIGVLVQLALVTRQWRRTRRIRRTSKPLDDPRLQAWCASQATRLGLRHRPQLRVSDAIDSPQVTGVWRAVVLLPARNVLAPDEQAMALAHELAHVRRGDLWLGWIPALAKGLFFFHPLVRLAVREYTLHREAACDGQALRLQRTTPQAYGQLLLRLGIKRSTPVGLTGVASPSFRQLKRRLAMLQHTGSAMPRPRDWVVVAVVTLAFVVPYRLVSASPTPQAATTVLATATGRATITADRAVFVQPPASAVATTAQSASAPVTAFEGCPGAGAQDASFCGAKLLLYTPSEIQGQSVILFDKHYVVIHGTDTDIDAAHRFYKPNASVLWFRRGNKNYVIRDPKLVARAWQIYGPTMLRLQRRMAREHWRDSKKTGLALAQKQAALVEKQAALVERRVALVQQQLQSTERLPAASGQPGRTALRAKQQALQATLKQLRHSLAALEGKLASGQQSPATQPARVAARARALARQQQQRKPAINHKPRAMQRLLDDALAKGLAQPVDQG